jgi:hypothetical protein
MRRKDSVTHRVFAILGILGMLTTGSVQASPICVDAGNPQYFYYGGKTTALVGTSAEYLCHIVQTMDLFGSYCMFSDPTVPPMYDYQAYINELSAKGLNVFRVWVGLNHSPGKEFNSSPYPNEQPFPYDISTNKWNAAADLNNDATWDTTYLNHLYEVIDFARTRNPSIIVEVTLFDPWSGNWALGPWNSANVYNGTGFSTEKDFATLPASTSCATAIASGPRKRQVDMMKRIAKKLNPLDNFYWEISNEPDIASTITGTETAIWHDCMVQQLYSYESTLPNGHHVIGVNYHSFDALSTIKNNSYPNSVPRIKVVNTHYVQKKDSAHQGAMELIRNWHLGSSGSLNRIFGFNETKITPFQQTPDTTRAEAWEFMLNEGGVYDHLGYEWEYSTGASTMRTYLGKLNTFLRGLDLRRMQRSTGNPPSWAPSLPAYPTWGDTTTQIYWAAMQDGVDTYVLYLHHSMLDSNKRHYLKPTSITRLTSLTVQPGSNGRTYTVQWINPATGATIGSTPSSIVADGLPKMLTVPNYTYDIALKVSDGVTTPSSLTCAAF